MFVFETSKPIILMIFCCLSISPIHIFLIRVMKRYGESAKPLIWSYVFSLMVWIIGLFILGAIYSSEISLLSFFSALFIYIGFSIGYLEFFSLINRGYSLSIVMDIAKTPSGLTEKELISSYAGGKGLKWMLDKRIQGLNRLKLIKITDGKMFLGEKKVLILVRLLKLGKSLFSLSKSG